MFARYLAAIVLVAAAIGGLIIAWPQLFGLEGAPIIAQAVSLRAATTSIGVGILALVVISAIASRRGRRFLMSLSAIITVFCLVNLAVLSSRGFGEGGVTADTADGVTVLSWNTLGDAPGSDTIARLALEQGADVVVLPETSRATGESVASAMAAAGMPMTAYTASYDEVSKARSTTLLINTALGAYTVDENARTTAVLPSLVATPVDPAEPTIIAVHPVAPIPGEMQNWRDDLQWLKGACRGPNIIMAGDFNSTMDHFAKLSTTAGAAVGDCFDSALVTGNAAVGTWPTAIPAILGAPIDHVMATDGWRTVGMHVIQSEDGSGSDHRPIVAHLERVE